RPGLRRAVPTRGEQRAVEAHPAMRARPDPRVVAVAPIGEVVPALAARPGVVGNLVAEQAEARRLLTRRLIERGGQIRLRQRDLAPPVLPLEHRAGLDGELV